MKMDSPLLSLNYDCQKRILDLLNYNDVVALISVSKPFRECAQDWMKRHWATRFREDSVSLVEDAIRCPDPVAFLETFGPCVNHVSFRDNRHKDQQKYLNMLPECCPNLDTLKMSFDLSFVANIEKLDLSFLGRLQSIRFLSLWGIFDESVLDEIAKIQNLERLSIKQNELIVGNGLSKLHNLKQLNLSFCKNFTSKQFIEVFQSNRNLTKIKIKKCKLIGPNAYRCMAADSRQLESLEFDASTLLDKEAELPELRHLKTLKIRGDKCEKELCVKLLQAYSKTLAETLTFLKLKEWKAFDLTHKLYFPNLIELKLNLADAERILQPISRMCPRLERITIKTHEFVRMEEDSLVRFFRESKNLVFADIGIRNCYNSNVYKAIVGIRKHARITRKLKLIAYRNVRRSFFDEFYDEMMGLDEFDRRNINNEIERYVDASMDLPPDKAKLLKNYDDEKKWDMICDKEMVHAKDPPSHYLTKLRTYLDPKASRSHRKRRIVGESTSTQVLRDLEISLRTNHIEWVKEFLDERNQGLDALVDYLNFRLLMMRHEQRIQEAKSESDERLNGGNVSLLQTSSTMDSKHHHNQQTNGFLRPSLGDVLDSPSIKRRSRHMAKLNMGASTDDIHVCIMCLRAIMNNKYGFNMVIQHREAINCIALSLIHKSLRTKALVLELLAAICLVKGGHEIILSSFDNFKEMCQETRRFQTLMDYFINYDCFNIDFMVACMQFVNIVVHSVEDMNYRVHLQYEFTALGLDKYLEKLRMTESEELQVQISAYLDNVFDVAALMEDSETKTAALERVQELEDDLSRALDRNAEMEREFMYKLAELESELNQVKSEREELLQGKRQADEEVSTLRKILKENEQELRNRESMLESKNLELESLAKTLPRGVSNHSNLANGGDGVTSTSAEGRNGGGGGGPAPPPPPPPPPKPPSSNAVSSPSPPAPPPPPMANSCNIPAPPNVPKPPPFMSTFAPPPPAAGFMPAPDGAMTIKRKVQTKYKLPTLNWIALKPNQVRGTIFNELDDEKLHKQIDFTDFEERFKIGMVRNGTSEIDGLASFPSKRFKKQENVSVLEHTRLRNIAISRRKLDMPITEVIAAINNLDLKKLSLENVEILQKMVPTEAEVKAYKEYIGEKKDQNLLTDEDKFMLQLTKVERIASKLQIMNYMGNFFDSLHLISPQIYAITNAANSLKSSRKFRAVLEIVLAFGNYMNSSKRGPAYGFKLQSLDTLLDTKSTDKRMCLLHYIVATVRQKFPELLNFDTELYCIDKAAQVSLENVVTDVHELEKGMEMVRKEADLRVKGAQMHILKDFLNNSEEKLKKIRTDSKNAQEMFKECIEYFGESSRNADANAFFSLLVRFTRAFKAADQENEQRRRLEQAAALAASKKETDEVRMRNKVNNQKKQQEAVINELKSKTNAVREKKLLHQDEVYNGALEDILLGLKSEPYRRADAVRRSQRRRIDSNRLSRTMEELDV